MYHSPIKRYRLDWITVCIYLVLVIIGLINLYAVDYHSNPSHESFMPPYVFKQGLWVVISLAIFCCMLFFNIYIYAHFSYVLYVISLLLLIGTIFFSQSVGGHQSWYQIGSIKIQPAEFSKLTCALAIARFLSQKDVCLTRLMNQIHTFLLIILPALLIFLQGDMGSAIIFSAFFIVLYRYHLPIVFFFFLIGFGLLLLLSLWIGTWPLIIGIIGVGIVCLFFQKSSKERIKIMIASLAFIVYILFTGFILNIILKPHHQNRIKTLIHPTTDPLGIGWNITQSKIAIGAGQLYGKGFLQGTQTKFNFIPEQRTDFIFCTVGEEYGWLGTTSVILLFLALFLRIIWLAERQGNRFSQIYGYCIVAIYFFHFSINIGMTIGMVPIIGIPLPFLSYGGSALCTFSVMLFIFLKLDMENIRY